jgi:amidase
MLKEEEYVKFSSVQIINLIKRGEIRPSEILETAIEVSRKLNPDLNAVILWIEDGVKEDLKNLERSDIKEKGKLYGVPLLLKDLRQHYPGVKSTDGSKILKDFISDYESEFVARIRKNGGLIFGKTNTSEFGFLGYTEPDLFGPTRNPWNLELTPGGSSGGSASAVASCMVPVASGSDGGGSIRIPACYTGLIGLKPSRGRTPAGPPHGEIWQGFGVNFFFARTTEDVALLLDAESGYSLTSPFKIEPPTERYSEVYKMEPKRLKVAFTTRSPIDTPVDKFYKDAVLKAAREFEKIGLYVEEREPEGWGWDIFHVFLSMYYGEANAILKELKEKYGKRVFSEVEATTLSLFALGELRSSGDYILSTWKRYELIYKLNLFFEKYDVFLTPTCAFLPAKIGELKPPKIQEEFLRISVRLGLFKLMDKVKVFRNILKQLEIKNFQRTPFTQYANITGVPAISLPIWLDEKAEIPSGIQIIAPFGREDLLLQISNLWENIEKWGNRFPPPYTKQKLGIKD